MPTDVEWRQGRGVGRAERPTFAESGPSDVWSQETIGSTPWPPGIQMTMARRFDELAAKIDLLQGAPPAPPRSKLATFFHEWGPAIGLAAAMAAGGYGLNHRLDQEREDRLQLAADVRDGFKSVQGSLDKLSDQLHDLDKREAVDGKKP